MKGQQRHAERRGGGPSRLAAVLVAVAALAAACGGSGTTTAGTVTASAEKVRTSKVTGAWAETLPSPLAVQLDDSPASQQDMDPSPGLTVSTPWPHPWPTSFQVGDAIPRKVPLYEKPGVRVPDNRQLSNPTWEGIRLEFLVRQVKGPWLQVQIQSRPNGATAWIRMADVALRTVENHIVVERGAKKINVYHGETLLLTAPVATGSDDSPTPIGSFFVDYIGRPETDDGPYGAFQLSVTGYSDVYTEFGGGVGQIALHGTNQPELIGTPASHGCVRMDNPIVRQVRDLAPVGTPVDIYP